MKAQIHVQQSWSTGKVVSRLLFLGGLILGCVYVFLTACSSLIKIFE
jgi:hypothetical protein